MATKNYGMTGVGQELEFAKNGLKLVSSGTLFQAYNNAEDTLVILRAADGVGETDVVTKGQLDTKQNTLSVADGSSSYISIDSDEISVTNLLISSVTVDTTWTTLADWVTNEYAGSTLEEGDVLVLSLATDQQQRTWIHNGGSVGDSSDFTRLQCDLSETVIRAMFEAGTGISYNSSTGVISCDATSSEISDGNSYTNISGSDVAALLASIDSVIGGALGDITNLQTLSGVADGSTDLGDFSGSTIDSGSTIKEALQDLETQLESTTASTFGERHADFDKDSGTVNIGAAIPDNSIIVDWYVMVDTPFDDLDATIEIGVSGNTNQVAGTDKADLQEAGVYVGHSNVHHVTGDTQYIATVVPDGSSLGVGHVILKYIIVD